VGKGPNRILALVGYREGMMIGRVNKRNRKGIWEEGDKGIEELKQRGDRTVLM
jgi:hypothetical protein